MPLRDLWIWRYELESATTLNATSSRTFFPGALLRSGSGFACLHPWPELGDPPLDDCLAHLEHTSLGQRALECLSLDGRAREAGRSLFENITVPRSHATLPQLNDRVILKARELGFTHLKVKVHRDPRPIQPLLTAHADLIWRLDFNGTGNPHMFDSWTAAECAPVDFVEDPFPPEEGSWHHLPITPAADRFRPEAPVIIVKPTVHTLTSLTKRTIFTSNMDHPLGQSFAAYQAGYWQSNEIAGLQTHGLFTPDAFTELLGPMSPSFQPAPGTGLGFDDLLTQLPWKKLS